MILSGDPTAARHHPAGRAGPHSVAVWLLALSLSITFAVVHYGTLFGSSALGVALGAHLLMLRQRRVPRWWISAVATTYIVGFSCALVFAPPLRLRQAARNWLPREEVLLCLRPTPFSAPLRPGDAVAYYPDLADPPLTIGNVIGITDQSLELDPGKLRIDGVPVPPRDPITRLLARAGDLSLALRIPRGHLAILPTNARIGNDASAQGDRLASDLARALIVPADRVVGRLPHESIHPQHAWPR